MFRITDSHGRTYVIMSCEACKYPIEYEHKREVETVYCPNCHRQHVVRRYTLDHGWRQGTEYDVS